MTNCELALKHLADCDKCFEAFRNLVIKEMAKQGDIIFTNEVDELRKSCNGLWIALQESVKLQSHYAELLNMHDGGQRRTFKNADAWIDRLIETNILNASIRRSK